MVKDGIATFVRLYLASKATKEGHNTFMSLFLYMAFSRAKALTPEEQEVLNFMNKGNCCSCKYSVQEVTNEKKLESFKNEKRQNHLFRKSTAKAHAGWQMHRDFC